MQMVNGNGFSFLNKISTEMPTRPVSGTIIDHIYTNIFNYDYKLSLIEWSVSDHNLALLSFKPNYCILNRTYTKTFINYENVAAALTQTPLDGINYDELSESIQNAIQQNTQTTTRTVSHRKRLLKPYMTQEILSLIDIR